MYNVECPECHSHNIRKGVGPAPLKIEARPWKQKPYPSPKNLCLDCSHEFNNSEDND